MSECELNIYRVGWISMIVLRVAMQPEAWFADIAMALPLHLVAAFVMWPD